MLLVGTILLLDYLPDFPDHLGQVLDIGCGNGALTIVLAKEYPDSMITGIDSLGKNWDYSQNV